MTYVLENSDSGMFAFLPNRQQKYKDKKLLLLHYVSRLNPSRTLQESSCIAAFVVYNK
jgi:hypothetical protein